VPGDVLSGGGGLKGFSGGELSGGDVEEEAEQGGSGDGSWAGDIDCGSSNMAISSIASSSELPGSSSLLMSSSEEKTGEEEERESP